jgi:excinuclease UvrABC helicase subunit UvrB
MFNKNYPSLFESVLSNETDLFESFFNQMNKTFKPTVGETKTENGFNEDGSRWYKTTFTSKDGSYTQSVYTSTPEFTTTWSPTWSPKRKPSTPTSKTPSTPTFTDAAVYELRTLLNKAVETQNYEDAVRLRDEIKTYEKNADEVNTLKSKLETAVSTQNYEDAIKLRDKINKFTNK